MTVRILLKLGLVCALVGLLFRMSTSYDTATRVHPYIPPLTHTPGLGVSMIGNHSPPPHLAIQMMQIPISTGHRTQMDLLYQQQENLIEDGFKNRITMQQQVQELLTLLPDDTASISLENRFHNEQRIGELNIWQDLLHSLPAQ